MTVLHMANRKCTACPLRDGCRGPVPAVGQGRIMLVGEGPGEEEDKRGRPFIGLAGKYLDALLAAAGVYRDECLVSNVVKCRPPGNRTPTRAEAALCGTRWLDTEIGLFRPEIIVAMGKVAIEHFIGEGVTVEHSHGIPRISPRSSVPVGTIKVREPRDARTAGQRGQYVESGTGRVLGRIQHSDSEDPTEVDGHDAGDTVYVLPVYHPAAGFYDTSIMRHLQADFQVLGKLARGEVVERVVDAYPEPRYMSAGEVLSFDPLVPTAYDTETVDGKLWSIQTSAKAGIATFYKPQYEKKPTISGPAIVHHFLYDAQYVDFPPETHDTMVQAYLLGLPRGLKELAWRLCGMEMQSYTEVLAGVRKEKAMEWLEGAALGQEPHLDREPAAADTCDWPDWPDPPTLDDVTWSKKDNKLVVTRKKPQHISRKIKRIIADVVGGKELKDGPVDPYVRWHKIDQRERTSVEEVLGSMPEGSLADVPGQDAIRYSCRDADATLRVFQALDPEMDRLGLRFAYEMDRRTLPIALEMMQTGVRVDVPYLQKLGWEYLLLMERKAEEIFKVAEVRCPCGCPTGDYSCQICNGTGLRRFNPNSDNDVRTVIYTDLGFKPTKYTPTRLPSVKKDELAKVKHPVAPLIIEYRHIAHLKDSFCDTLPGKVDEGGRIHPTIKTTSTETGRWSMAEPNLQQIPARDELGMAIRKGFIAGEGNLLVACDYSQIEVRVAAHLSQCQAMMQLFWEARDIHTETAARIFGVPTEAVTKKQRYPAKTMGFGVMYGLTAQGLLNQMTKEEAEGWDLRRCEKFIKDYFKLYPELWDWQQSTKSFARRHGYVTDIFGRIRWVPELQCPIDKFQAAGERQAINMPVQATAAGILKLAMVKVWEVTPSAQWLLQVHDELVWEMPAVQASEFIRQVVPVMEGAVKLSVPVLVEAKTGENWGEMS